MCCVEMLKLLDEKGLLTTDLEYVQSICSSGTIKKKKNKLPPVERQGKYDETKCQARIWSEGYDSIQCQFSPTTGCFCKRHQSCSEGKWWLGNINEERPEKPILYSGSNPEGIEHKWREEKVEEEKAEQSEKVDEEAPKRRGRPKGSKNKKKNEAKKEKNEITMDELQALIDKKQEMIKNN